MTGNLSKLIRTSLTASLVLGLSFSATADCSDRYSSCSASCESSMTSGFIVGLAGALGRNNSAYQQGQRELLQAQACSERCSAQFNMCTTAEQAHREREEANRIAERQRMEAQQRATQQQAEEQERARAEFEQRKRRANRIVSPPVTAPLAIKDAAPLIQLAQSHLREGNQDAAVQIFKMVIRGSNNQKQVQVARTWLKPIAIEKIVVAGTGKAGDYQRAMAEYQEFAVLSASEQAQLQAMAPIGVQAEVSARDYLRKNPNGPLREVAAMVVQMGPKIAAAEAEEQKRLKEAIDDQARQQAIRAIPRNGLQWVPTNAGCSVYSFLEAEASDAHWSGSCTDGKGTGQGIFLQLDAGRNVLLRYEGALVNGAMDGPGVMNLSTGFMYQGWRRGSLRDGEGRATFTDGAIYEGEWRNNQPHGKGVMTWINGERYSGEYANGKRHGQGTYSWANGHRYQGSWVEGSRKGQATYWYGDDGYFVGEMEGTKEVNGTLYGSNGRVQATYVNGQRINQ